MARDGNSAIPSKLSTSNSDFIILISRANCTVCTVELLPEPWKARSVGFTPVSLLLYVMFESQSILMPMQTFLVFRNASSSGMQMIAGQGVKLVVMVGSMVVRTSDSGAGNPSCLS